MMMDAANRIGVFFSGTDESLLSRATVHVTGRKLPDQSDVYSHCGLVFDMAIGRADYYEARWGRCVEGPLPLAKLTAWQEGNPAKRRLKIIWLDTTPEAATRILYRAQDWVGVMSYSEWQLLAMYAFEAWGWPLRPTPNFVVCSELVVRALYPDYLVPYDPEHPTLDSVNPNSLYRQLCGVRPGATLTELAAGLARLARARNNEDEWGYA